MRIDALHTGITFAVGVQMGARLVRGHNRGASPVVRRQAPPTVR